SLAIAEAAVRAGQEVFDSGAGSAEAMIAAERAARLAGARDWRCLANITGRGLRPFERLGGERQDKLVLWVAVDQSGYWAQASTPAATRGAAAGAMTRMMAAAKAGARAGDVADAALTGLPECDAELALSYGFGSGIGLDLEEAPLLVPGNDTILVEGGLLALRIFLDSTSEMATAMVVVGTEGARGISAS
ncbi:MAG: hypothetical protein JWN59_1086, partial [Sphingomonas bacterium]|nr:hypothetical protein [Sphingomonas bacterium]